jgi:hypothetical protein
MSDKKKLERVGKEAYNIVKNQVHKSAVGVDPTKDRVAIAAKLVKRLAEREGLTVKQVEAEAQRISS